MPVLGSPADVRALLARVKTVAVVGLSDDPARDSHAVAAYLQAAGYRVIPVNPRAASILGETSRASLSDIPEAERAAVDLVDVFRRSDAALEVAREAAALRLPAIWFQLGVATPEAIRAAEEAGMDVVSGACIKTAHQILRPGRTP